jgi:hypothetical protein
MTPALATPLVATPLVANWRKPKKQTTRLLKLVCDQCGFTCRTTAKHIAADGLICPVPICAGDLVRSS